MSKIVDGMVIDCRDEQVRRDFIRRFDKLRDVVQVDIAKWRGTKSNWIMRYYRGFVVKTLHEFMRKQGDVRTAEYWHQFLAGKRLAESVYDPRDRKYLGETRRSTADLSDEEFFDYIEWCVAWIADNTGEIVDPPTMQLRHQLDNYKPKRRKAG